MDHILLMLLLCGVVYPKNLYESRLQQNKTKDLGLKSFAVGACFFTDWSLLSEAFLLIGACFRLKSRLQSVNPRTVCKTNY